MGTDAAFDDLKATHDLDEEKRIKVRIRISQHIQLHRIRLLKDQSLSETVRAALESYFEELPDVEG